MSSMSTSGSSPTPGRSVLITGASGNIGVKLRRHLGQSGHYRLTLLCMNPDADPAVEAVDLSRYDGAWPQRFEGVDTVIHLAGDPSPRSPWSSIQPNNVDLTLNVFQAARLHRCRRVIFASSNWVMAGYRFGSERLTTDLPPRPINPYGQAKLFGERLGRSFAELDGPSCIAFRIGWCQKDHDNQPGPHMSMGRWGQQMWLSDRDLCHGIERAILAEGVGFAVLNLTSDNPGMRWDIEETRRVIGFDPKDGHLAVVTDESAEREDLVRVERELAGRLDQLAMQQRW